MIKINLSTAKKQVDISNIGGFDFTKLKIKAVLLVIGLIYVPDFVLVPMWEKDRENLNSQVSEKEGKLSGLKRKVSQSKELENQIKELKAQEENLGKKLTAVKQAISEKKNPAPILLYIAQNTPQDLWIKELELSTEQMLIKGESFDYTTIGNFVTSLRNSIYIRDANITNTSSTTRDSDKRRIESFEVKFGIARFD